MGYRSDVTIMCEAKAYEMFKEAWKKVDFKPHHIYQTEVNGDYQYTLCWEWVKWYEDYKEIKAITNVMDILDGHEDEEGYAYKIIEIGEENDTTERENEGGYLFEDFYVRVDVNLPSDNVEIDE